LRVGIALSLISYLTLIALALAGARRRRKSAEKIPTSEGRLGYDPDRQVLHDLADLRGECTASF
jgi:hypothetical protein